MNALHVALWLWFPFFAVAFTVAVGNDIEKKDGWPATISASGIIGCVGSVMAFCIVMAFT